MGGGGIVAQLLPGGLADPLLADAVADAAPPPPEILETFSFNFDTRRLLVKGQRVQKVAGDAALLAWIRTALRVERGRHLVYNRQFGVEFRELIGQSVPVEEMETELGRMVREALMVDARIRAVRNVVTDVGADWIKIQFHIETVFADVRQFDFTLEV